MSKFNVLVTGTAVSEQARKLLRDADAEVVFMQNPVDEKALLEEFSRCSCAGRLHSRRLSSRPPGT